MLSLKPPILVQPELPGKELFIEEVELVDEKVARWQRQFYRRDPK
jgi:hypothetical protein